MDASQPRNLAPGLPAYLTNKPRWILNRLRCMSPAEVAFRVARALRARAERLGVSGAGRVPAPEAGAALQPWVHAPSNIDAARYVAAAERIRSGELDIFALRAVNL